MANEFVQTMADARVDAGSLEKFINGSEDETVLTRLSAQYPSLQNAIKQMFENGGLPATPFKTEALMTASSLPDGSYAMVTDDIVGANGIYIKTSQGWSLSAYNPMASVKNLLEVESSRFLKYRDIPPSEEVIRGVYVSAEEGKLVTNRSLSYITYKYTIEQNTDYIFTVSGSKTRFRAALVNSINTDYEDLELDEVLLNNDKKNELIFNSKDAREIYIYLGDTQDLEKSLTVLSRKVEGGVLADGLSTPLDTSGIADKAVTTAKTDFLVESLDNLEVTKTDLSVFNNDTLGTTYLRRKDGGNNYLAKIPASAYIKIELTGSNDNSRFRVAVVNTIPLPEGSETALVDMSITQDVSLRSVGFQNESLDGWLVISLSDNSGNTIDTEPVITQITRKINGLSATGSTSSTEARYKLEFGKIENSVKSTISSKAEYPRLACVKYEYAKDTQPIPVGYLYTTNNAPYEYLYSSGVPDDMVKIADWDMSITRDGSKTPSHCTSYVTDDGDIIVLHRGDLFGGLSPNPDARQNPIIYPAGDYNNPIVVDFGSRIKPTGWARCNGVTSVPDKDFFLFSEYTRTAHAKAYMWKVTKPYTNPDNWVIVAEFVVDRKPEVGQGDMKHWHATNYDPYSGAILASFGDHGVGAKILISKDDGDTWTVEAEGDEGKCRLSQYIFTKDYVYWGSDSASSNHLFMRAPRDSEGYPKLTLDDLEVVEQFPKAAGFVATYNTVYLSDPHGLLFLDRNDDPSKLTPLQILFWSFDDEQMYVVKEIEKLDSIGVSESNGFRCDTVTLYQPLNDDRVTIGFNSAFAQNAMKVAGNSMDDRVNNLTLKVIKY